MPIIVILRVHLVTRCPYLYKVFTSSPVVSRTKECLFWQYICILELNRSHNFAIIFTAVVKQMTARQQQHLHCYCRPNMTAVGHKLEIWELTATVGYRFMGEKSAPWELNDDSILRPTH